MIHHSGKTTFLREKKKKKAAVFKEVVDAGLQNPTRSPEAAESSQQQQQAQAQRQHSSKSQQVEEVVKEGQKAQVTQLQANIPLGSEESKWVISIREKLELAGHDDESITMAKLCIYRVPRSLRDPVDNKAYIPQVVSLGPYHHDDSHLQEMERHKWRALHHTLKRRGQDIKIYLDSVKKLEEKARACYESPIRPSSNQFVQMMVLDGCFILELFRGFDEGFKALGYSPNDCVFSRGTISSFERDMLMLENQIPLFILDTLYALQLPEQKGHVAKLALGFFKSLMSTEPNKVSDPTKWESSIGHLTTACLNVFRSRPLDKGSRRGSHANQEEDRRQQLIHCATDHMNAGVKFRKGKPQQKGHVALLTLRCFESLMSTEPFTVSDPTKPESSISHLTTASDPSSDHPHLHCLDVFRCSLLNEGSTRRSFANQEADRRQQLIHCAMDLKNAGIKFKKRDIDRFWDIKFDNGVLEIPQLLIHDDTKSLLFNLIAFEQCHVECTNMITCYVIFMDNLINTAEDVAHLRRHGIIEHMLGSDTEVADLINRSCHEVVFDLDDSYLSELTGQVNTYYKQRWNTWKATLWHKYFNNPWTIMSLTAAVFLLVLTFTQTFFAVYSYYRPSS
ncbi:hypothetical protein Ancab_011020 [Ancistrocladus abbreviatus]